MTAWVAGTLRGPSLFVLGFLPLPPHVQQPDSCYFTDWLAAHILIRGQDYDYSLDMWSLGCMLNSPILATLLTDCRPSFCAFAGLRL